MSRQQIFPASIPIGETTDGSVPSLVFHDLHTSIISGGINPAPGTTITGGPGQGKTFLALTLAANAAMLGKTVVCVDQKNDFLALKSLEDQIGRVDVWNLRKGRPGMIDPFYMTSERGERLQLATDLITLFNGGSLSENEEAALTPILQDVAEERYPSMVRVVDVLLGSDAPGARILGMRLKKIMQMPFGRLCFASNVVGRKTLTIRPGTTVIVTEGLQIPLAGNPPSSPSENLAVGVLYLLTNFLRRVMDDETSGRQASLFIDEAHAFLSNDTCTKSVKNLLLLGRSKALTTCLITQLNSHLDGLEAENAISTRFAFRTDKKDARATLLAMRLSTEDGLEALLHSELEPGYCFMQDWKSREAVVHIVSWNKEWAKVFETNPAKKALIAKQKADAAASARGVTGTADKAMSSRA